MQLIEPKIPAAIKKSGEMLTEQKKRLGQKMVISVNGKIQVIDYSKDNNNSPILKGIKRQLLKLFRNSFS